MAADPEVDAVYIGTPNQTHCEYTLICLNAGKAVLCEKPLAVNAAEGRIMIETARAKGVLLMEAMISKLNPNFRAAVDKVSEIAPIRNYTSFYCQYSTKYEALKRGEIASSFMPGTAGALRDIGVYTIYPLVALFGRPTKIHGKLNTRPLPALPMCVEQRVLNIRKCPPPSHGPRHTTVSNRPKSQVKAEISSWTRFILQEKLRSSHTQLLTQVRVPSQEGL